MRVNLLEVCKIENNPKYYVINELECKSVQPRYIYQIYTVYISDPGNYMPKPIFIITQVTGLHIKTKAHDTGCIKQDN